jgi:hypothetical protein
LTLWDTFSKRQKRLKGEFVDVFTYEIPHPLRVQISNLWIECFGSAKREYTGNNPAYETLHKIMSNEFGLFSFGSSVLRDHVNAIVDFFVDQATTEQSLDMIDMSFRYALLKHRDREWVNTFRVKISDEDAIEQLNVRFLEHGVGYEFILGESPQLIRKDNEHLHKEAVIPALRLLHEEGFAGADAEYRRAHEHYRKGAYKECLNECLKAFESTMTTICAKRKWPSKPTDTARALIDICLKNGLLPPFMQSRLGTIKSALESAIPTVRNKLSGHGQGEQPKSVPKFYAEYLLHETAATIVFLVDAYKALE